MQKFLLFAAFAAVSLGGCTPSVSPETSPETSLNPAVAPSATTGEMMSESTENTSAGPGEFQTTASGLKYRILREGDGPKPGPNDTVRVHYRGWLPDPSNGDEGTEFDSSYSRGEPIQFPLNGVIPGWGEGMQLVGEGGEIELEIPPNLGYGAAGAGGVIPPNATLRFVVELLAPPKPVEPGPVDADAEEEFQTTASGLKYRIRRKGNGDHPKATDRVTVHYRGWLPDSSDPTTGKEFDSSYGRGESISFPLNGVIPGWTEGMQLVREGGMIELDIPSELAYGSRDMGDIPPNSDLRFLVELLKID